MSPTSDDLMEIARSGADRIDLDGEVRRFPSFGDIEDQCEAEYDELLEALRDDEVFRPVSLERQEALVKALKAALDDEGSTRLDELLDNVTRHTWLHQEGAFHLGMAVGLRIAEGRRQ